MSPIATRGTAWKTVEPSPSSTVPTAAMVSEPNIPLCGPKRTSTGEERTSPRTAPADMPRMRRPMADGSLPSPRSSRTPGMRATHVAVASPLSTNTAKTALRQATSWRRLRAGTEVEEVGVGCDIGCPGDRAGGGWILVIESFRSKRFD